MVLDKIAGFFKPHQPIPPGIYSYQSPPDSGRQIRFHLRVHKDGTGLLILNASTVLHLNQTGAEYAYHMTQQTSVEDTAGRIARRYQISRTKARGDYLDFQHKVNTILDVPDLDPITFFDLDREQPYSGAETAPYRLDCALTYQLPAGSNPDLAPTRRVDRELSTGEWKTILEKAWGAGIPHITFTGGEPTLRPDLLDLIKQAEANGQVTGLLTGGQRLGDPDYLESLLQTGLDHLLFVVSPKDQNGLDILSRVLDQDLFTTVHLTLKPDYLDEVSGLITELSELGANALSLSVSDPGNPVLTSALEEARTLAADLKLSLKWDLPVPYSRHHPVALEAGQEEPSLQDSRAVLYVEPDGDVLPAQGVNRVLGNLARDSWEVVWNTAAGIKQSTAG